MTIEHTQNAVDTQHNTPEQPGIVLCRTDPSSSQQALHDEWAQQWLAPSYPLLFLFLYATTISPPTLSLPCPRPNTTQLLPSHMIHSHSVHLVLVL